MGLEMGPDLGWKNGLVMWASHVGQTISKNTKNHKNKRKSISKLFHAQTGSIWFQIGSYLVPIGSYGFYSSQIGS